MKKHDFIFIVLTLLFTLPISISAQSRYLEDGIGGPGFEFSMGIVDYGLTTFGMTAAYSIGGIMDIGVFADRETGTLGNDPNTDINVGFLYNLIVVKQTEYIPFNLQLEGSYGYTNVSSDYLDGLDLQKEGQGFQLGMSIYSEILIISKFGILVGGKGLYTNYIFTTTDVPVPAEPVVYNLERIEELEFGFLSSISMKMD
ncbi:MAG: hypothetical protein KAR21_24800 [Spirochaetales bacterium]|nr:hypothetical protein [Spirochaetales bacterium]